MITVKEIIEIIEAESVQENSSSNNRILIHQDFELVAEQIVKKLTIPRVVNCKHEDYTPCYGREGELMFKQCDTCREEFD